jgi:transcriptional repressor NrdR
MRCPKCLYADTKVCDTRNTQVGRIVRRRRECEKCHYRFTTVEEVKILDLKVEKRNGQLVDFSEENMAKGIRKSFNKRSININKINAVIQKVVDDILETGKNPVKSTKIGKIVLKNLKAVDEVAYICFAAMFLNFENLDDFSRLVKNIQKEGEV